jgi:S1-C subfamily serine protease
MTRSASRWRRAAVLAAVGIAPALLAAGLVATGPSAWAAEGDKPAPVDKRVVAAEKNRVQVINKVKSSVVAVMARDMRGSLRGNGSGVLIDEEGYALTNFHVTSAARSPLLKCGLPDGKVYDAVLVGLDKVGDVALIKLLPPKDNPKFKFPNARLGDSEKVKAGDWSLAMGNPFSLATDFTPTVTFGLISGVHRYQYPAGTLLEYTDCIQIDTSINPGNSGGPLFNMDGELIGINGRGSFEKRGRVNSGVGYAISINQIKNFMGHLRAGIDTDHASLGASMESEAEDGSLSRILVRGIIDSDAKRRGLDTGDQLVSFAGRPMTTVNMFKNVLGLYPKGWRVPMTYRRDNTRTTALVRLMGVQRAVIDDRPGAPGRPRPPRMPGPPVPAGPPSPAAKLYKAKAGFANFYFNELARDRLLKAFKEHGDYSKLAGDWQIKFRGSLQVSRPHRDITGLFLIKDRGAADGKSPKILADIDGFDFMLEPLSNATKADDFKEPADSGGLLLALYHYRQFLVLGMKGFKEFDHGGVEPFYPPTGREKPDYAAIRVDAEVIRTTFAGVPARWYFAMADDKQGRWKKGQMIGFEVTADKDEDPCEVALSHYKDIGGGRLFPSQIAVRRVDKPYAKMTVTETTLK